QQVVVDRLRYRALATINVGARLDKFVDDADFEGYLPVVDLSHESVRKAAIAPRTDHIGTGYRETRQTVARWLERASRCAGIYRTGAPRPGASSSSASLAPR